MKKLFLILAVATVALTANAQSKSFTGNKFFDNWYVGVNGGIGGNTTSFKVNGDAGIRVGKNITPAFGVGLEGNYYFSNDTKEGRASDAGFLQLGVFGNLNLMNTIGGYKGQPRPFEVYLLSGFYWGRNTGTFSTMTERNIFVNKIAFDFAYNFGKAKQFQVYVEPSINYAIAGIEGKQGWKAEYNINTSYLTFNAGLIYKFKTSNGTHNFLLVDAKDPQEIADLNSQINSLRASDAEKAAVIVQKTKQIADLQAALDQCNKKPVATKTVPVEPGLPSIFFQCGKSAIAPAQMQNVKIAADIMKKHPTYKLAIKGYASPEGNAENNKKLAINRAEAVKDMLVKKYGIEESRITSEGCGTTDSLFEIYEFNRVSMMFLDKK